MIMDDAKIRGECSALVRYMKPSDGSGNGTLVLSHSAVHTFLREHSDNHQCTENNCLETHVVSADILRQCCVKYLLQPRYSTTLEQRGRLNFVSGDGTSLKEHQFALYAAKYWYRHCDDLLPSDETKDLVRRLLESENFQTCLQIQSVSIIGHFLISYHPLTGRPRSLKQNLPAWTPLIDTDTHKFHEQYKDFLREWSHLLQLGLSYRFNGEVDRVFWKMLGQQSFLSNGQCRYKSFLIGDRPGCPSGRFSTSSCMFLSSSSDGQRHTALYVSTKS